MNHTERMRFAPSPTGDLHVGGARAALFNWLYARKVGGKFLLRIEDTDTERSNDVSLQSILDSLRWLGLDWDEELVFQSKRGDLYKKSLEKLIESGDAYRCYCTVDELEAEREKAMAGKLPYKYSGRCRNLSENEKNVCTEENRPFTIRFRVPDGDTSFDDYVHGVTTFRNDTIGDFIIARADGSPVYILGVAVDDSDMKITLVMRGDDHISNTPKQIMLMKALGSEIPKFAHLPQVLGADKKKLSKRHGAASVMEYRNMGFLPQAVVNFLALLGWNPGDEREKMSLDELINAFSIENISKKSGVFDIQKLEWLNGLYLNELPVTELIELAAPFLVEKGLIEESELGSKTEYIGEVVKLLGERCRLASDFADLGSYFFKEPEAYDEAGVKKHFKEAVVADYLESLANSFEENPSFKAEDAERATRELSEKLELNASKLIHPTRLAVSGMTFGPGLFELLALIGKEKVVARMRKGAEFVRKLQ